MNCFKACFGILHRHEPPPPPPSNYLYALDFDQTILRADSESAITEALHSEIPDGLLALYDGENWAEFCGLLIDYVVQNGASMTHMAQCIRELEPLPGMKTLLLRISNTINGNPKSHFIVISGSNDFFIRTFLDGIRPRVTHTYIISNHAQLSTTIPKTLIFTPYENQRTCPICPRFLCKGNALETYIGTNGPFTQVYYVGDGCNDVCPAQRLTDGDILFVRENFELERVIRFGYYGGKPLDIRATIVYFRNAKQIQKFMKF